MAKRHIISVSVSTTQFRILKKLARAYQMNMSTLMRTHMFAHHTPKYLFLNHRAIMAISSQIDTCNRLLNQLDTHLQHQKQAIDLSLRKKAQGMDKHLELKPLNVARASLTDTHSKQLESLYDYETKTLTPYLKQISKKLISTETLLSRKLTQR